MLKQIINTATHNKSIYRNRCMIQWVYIIRILNHCFKIKAKSIFK